MARKTYTPENSRLKKLVADITELAMKYGRYGYRRDSRSEGGYGLMMVHVSG